MPQTNSLDFTEIKSEFLESLRGKCAQDESYEKVWNVVLLRDPDDSKLSSTPRLYPLLLRPSIIIGRIISIYDGYLLHKG